MSLPPISALIPPLVGFAATYGALALVSYAMMSDWESGVLLFALVFILPFGLNLFLIVLFWWFVVHGVRKGRPEFVWAPFLFMGLWFVASVIHRSVFTIGGAEYAPREPLPSDLATLPTLIVDADSAPDCCVFSKLLADGYVSSIVSAEYHQPSRETRIVERYLSKGPGCTTEDVRYTLPLLKAGRVDDCINSRILEKEPDGLVLKYRRARAHCCFRGEFAIRSAGFDRVVVDWLAGQRFILSYFPLLGPLSIFERLDRKPRSASLWSADPIGPVQKVSIGGPSFDVKSMIQAVYGPSLSQPITPVADDATLKANGMLLLKDPIPEKRSAALDIALLLQQRNKVDDDVLEIAAFFAGNGSNEAHGLYEFWTNLPQEQKHLLFKSYLEKIGDPQRAEEASGPYFQARDLTIGVDDFRREAERLFIERRGLSDGQYRMILEAVWQWTAPTSDVYSAFLESVLHDESSSFAPRAIAFLRSFSRGGRFAFELERDRQLFIERLDRVPDDLVSSYVFAIGWRDRGDGDDGKAFREVVLRRIDKIADEKARSQVKYDLNLRDG